MNHLKRSLNLPLLVFYGLGNILGAGIYVLVGKVAGQAGMYTPVAFIVACIVAAFTAFSYAELSARYPVSAGEAVYVHEGTGLRWLAVAVGLLLALAGIVSAATISLGFAGYLQVFFQVPVWLVVVLLVGSLALIAIWGILQSVGLAAALTLVEIVGLLIIIVAGSPSLVELPARLPEILPAPRASVWSGILLGAFLAFYAFLGFEDMVNVAEEVKSPQRLMPRAIILALIISAMLYFLVSLVAIMAVPPEQLQQSDAPLAMVYTQATGRQPVFITLISLLAVVNGALIQIIMASRIVYGMGSRGWLPVQLSSLHPRTQTPVLATLLASGLLLGLALFFPLEELARTTSTILLVVFTLVNISLCLIKKNDPVPEGVRVYPMWIPVTGVVLNIALLGVQVAYLQG